MDPKLMTRPHIELLRENNVRQGFLEPDEMRQVLKPLPANLRPHAPRHATFSRAEPRARERRPRGEGAHLEPTLRARY